MNNFAKCGRGMTTKYHCLFKSSMKGGPDGPLALRVWTGQYYLKDVQGDWKQHNQRGHVTTHGDSVGSHVG